MKRKEDILKNNRRMLESGTVSEDGATTIAFTYSHLELGGLICYFVSTNEVAPNLFIVEAEPFSLSSKKENDYCPYQAIMTLDGEILVDFKERDLVEYFFTKNKEHYCFTFMEKEISDKQSYLIKREGNDYFPIVPKIHGEFTSNYWFTKMNIEGEYFMCTRVNQFGMDEFQVYSPNELQFVSNVYNELDFDIEDTPYLAYFYRMIYEEDPSDKGGYLIYTSVIGYLGYNFMPGSDIYDMTSKKFYKTSSWRGLSSLEDLEEKLKEEYSIKYLVKMDEAEQALRYMIQNPNKVEMKKQEGKGKILTFKQK